MNSPFERREEPIPIADVNVVPLADVSLVLLIILLVLSPLTAQSMLRVQAAAAKADAGPRPGVDPLQPKPPEPALALGLSPLGYVADGRLLSGDASMRAWLAPRLARREDKKVFLAPELDVTNGRVVSAIEAISACGASAVALVQVADPQTPGSGR